MKTLFNQLRMRVAFAKRERCPMSVGLLRSASNRRAAIGRFGPPPDPGPDPGGGSIHSVASMSLQSPSTTFPFSASPTLTTTTEKGFSMNRHLSPRFHTWLTAAMCTALVACTALRSDAASFTWTGAGANGLWSTGTNWAPTVLPASGTHTVTYNNNVNTTGTAGSGYTLSALDFTSTAGSFTIDGQTTSTQINIRGNITNASPNLQTINTQLRYPTGTNTGTFDIGGVGSIYLGNQLISGTGVTLNVNGPGTVTLGAASPSFLGVMQTGAAGIVRTDPNNSASVGAFVNSGKLLIDGDFSVTNSMNLASTGTVAFQVPANVNDVNTISYGGGSNYGGTLDLALAGLYPGATLANPTVFQLFQPNDTLATGSFSTITAIYDGTPLTFSPVGAPLPAGYWASNAIVGGAQDGQYLVFDHDNGVLMVVPEPSAMVVAGIGVALAGWRMARRRKGAKTPA